MKQYILIAIIVGVFAVGIMTGAFGGHVAHVNHMEKMMSGGMEGMSGGMSGMSGGMEGMSGGMSGMSGGMSGMSGGMSGMSGGMSGMSGMGSMSGGQSRHGQFYSPGTVHQTCHQDSTMSPAYCEPYYQTMSSIPGVKITSIHPVDNNTLEVTLREISTAKNGIHQDTTLFVGNNFLSGNVNIPSGWEDKTTVKIPLSGMGIIYDYESMHAHLAVSNDSSMDDM